MTRLLDSKNTVVYGSGGIGAGITATVVNVTSGLVAR
jgi:hypothetical protein